MTSEPALHAEWMYGMFDYETWIVCRGQQHIGLLSLNNMDRTVDVRAIEPHTVSELLDVPVTYRRAYRWVETHSVRLP